MILKNKNYLNIAHKNLKFLTKIKDFIAISTTNFLIILYFCQDVIKN